MMINITPIEDFNFKETYKQYRKDIQDLFVTLHNKQGNALLEVYCDFVDNKWDEEKLGTYQGDAFALALYYFIQCNVSPYDLHLYRMTTRDGKSTEEAKDLFLQLVYSSWWREVTLQSLEKAITEVENSIPHS